MHRRVTVKRNNNWNNNYAYDRDGESSESKKVSFLNRVGHIKPRRNRNWNNKVRVMLEEEDVDMVANTQQFVGKNRHIRGMGRRGGHRIPRDSPGPRIRNLQESPVHWYKVIVQKGYRYEKQYLYQILLNYIKPNTLIPYGYAKTSHDISFFVDNFETAEKLLLADGKITANDGWKLRIVVKPNFPPITIDDNLKEKLKFVMSKRYNLVTKALDLSKFHGDPDFMKEDLLVALNRLHTLSEVVRIIAESIPDIIGIDLSDNKLSVIEPLKILGEKTPNLKVIHLGQNMFRSLHSFEVLKTLPIEELVLDGNPVCDRYNNQDVYVRDVRKRFPKIVKLDGVILPREISFDLEDTHKLKPSQGSFLCDPAGSVIVRQFLEQYYILYDSNSRGPLIDAYREDACFSLTATTSGKNVNSLSAYASHNRNLYHNPRRMNGLLKKGRASIIAFIESLPPTQHDPASFAVDLSFFSAKLIILSVCGVFREVGVKLPVRAFNRAFTIVPAGSGFCIINDLLHICLATPEQAKEAFKEVSQPVVIPPTPVAAIPTAAVVSPEVELIRRQQMVSTLAVQSGMNISWSEKCLNDTNWDYDKALYVFMELQKQGKIPAEAFIK